MQIQKILISLIKLASTSTLLQVNFKVKNYFFIIFEQKFVDGAAFGAKKIERDQVKKIIIDIISLFN